MSPYSRSQKYHYRTNSDRPAPCTPRTMAKPKRTAKKRTKTAVAARRYERRLKQRVKAGDEDAIGIVERRKEYSRRYEEKRRQMRATEDESRGHEDTNSEVQVSTEGGAERHSTAVDSTPSADCWKASRKKAGLERRRCFAHRHLRRR